MWKLWWLVALFLGLLASFSHAETWSVGPERWFVGTREVPAGTPGAISGEILARLNLTDHQKEYRDSFCLDGLADGPKDKFPCNEHHDDKRLIVVGGGYPYYGYPQHEYSQYGRNHREHSYKHRRHPIKSAHHRRGRK